MDTASKSVFSVGPQACRSATPRHRVADEQMRNTESKTIDLRAQLSKALQAGRFTQALDLYTSLPISTYLATYSCIPRYL